MSLIEHEQRQLRRLETLIDVVYGITIWRLFTLLPRPEENPAWRALPEMLLDSGLNFAIAVIALVIVAIALTSGLKIVGQYTNNLVGVQERTWAHWVAMNNMVDLQLTGKWPKTGKVNGSERETPFGFAWQRTVTETPFERIRRIEVQVLHANLKSSFTIRGRVGSLPVCGGCFNGLGTLM